MKVSPATSESKLPLSTASELNHRSTHMLHYLCRICMRSLEIEVTSKPQQQFYRGRSVGMVYYKQTYPWEVLLWFHHITLSFKILYFLSFHDLSPSHIHWVAEVAYVSPRQLFHVHSSFHLRKLELQRSLQKSAQDRLEKESVTFLGQV